MKGWKGDSAGHAKAGKQGGMKTFVTNGAEFYRKIGKLGGKQSPKNFKHDHKRASEAGRKGGLARKRKFEEMQKKLEEERKVENIT